MSNEWNGVDMFHIAHVIQFTPKTITFAVNLAGLSVLRGNFGKHLVENYAMSVIVGVDNNATINPSSSSDFKIVAAHIKKSAKKKSIF